MDRISNYMPVHRSIGEVVVYGKKDSVPLDQTSVQPFNIDPKTGRPIYDITCIIRAQNLAEQQRLIDNLLKFGSDFLPDDVTNDQALEYSVPRLCQMPSELAEFTEAVNKAKFEKWKQQMQIEDDKKAQEEYDELVKSIREERLKSKVFDSESVESKK